MMMMMETAHKRQAPWPGMTSSAEEEEEEEDSLKAALFATQCVEEVGLFCDRYSAQAKRTEATKMKTQKNKKKSEKKGKRPQKAAAATRALCNARAGAERTKMMEEIKNNRTNKLMVATYEHNKNYGRRKRGLWNADTELSLWTNLANLVGQYERHLSVLVPLHPSVLHEDNIRFALMSQPSERIEDFPLLFNVNVAMACGIYFLQRSSPSLSLILQDSTSGWWTISNTTPHVASIVASQLVGNKQREVEFMMRARHHLEYLFDSSHMEVAEGLVCMAYYSFCQVMRWSDENKNSPLLCFVLSICNMGEGMS